MVRGLTPSSDEVILPESGNKKTTLVTTRVIGEILDDYKAESKDVFGEKLTRMTAEAKYDVPISIIGCFTYKGLSDFSNEVHESSFAFGIGPKETGDVNGAMPLAVDKIYNKREVSVSDKEALATYADQAGWN